MRLKLERVLPVLLLSALVLAGAAPLQRISQEDRITALETKLAGIEAAQETALGRVEQMRLDFDNSLEPMRVRLADYGEDMRGMESRLVAIEEQVAMMNERLMNIADDLAAGGGAATSRPSAGMAMPPPQRPAGVPGPAVARPASGAVEPDTARSEADSLYSAAYTDYLAANYALALDGFEEYLRLFPDSDLADNAQYWIGESYYSRLQYQLARTAFLEIPRRFPDAETVPDALFKAARCLVELGDGARAVDELIGLVRDYPSSEAMPIACLQIERLGAEKPLVCPDK